MINVPDELDLFTFFEREPIESVPEDGYYCYKLTDGRGIDLYFSFHETEGSVQAKLMYNDCELAVFSEECAEKITIERDNAGEYLECIFKLCQAESKAKIHVRPSIKIHWHTLQA